MQGSGLSPFLFNLYIDDLIEEISKYCLCLGYADDIIIICKKQYTEIVIKFIEESCVNNKMKLNKNKCGILNIRKRKNKDTDKNEICGIQ